METLDQLKPNSVWKYFGQICNIPRPSGKEEKIRNFIIDFGKKNQLDVKVDNVGNVLITKHSASTQGKKPIILQSHMDMVCEKDSSVLHNFDIDPIQPAIDGKWIRAERTTLGADDGIGIAMQLAILESGTIYPGGVECLFTVDEETGLHGARGIQPGFLTGELLINLDSEEEGEICIGCAGGMDSVATFEYSKAQVPDHHKAFKIIISGLKGGHSGEDIHKELGNSNQILNRFLIQLLNEFEIGLALFDGGNLRNAIPREAYAIITVSDKYEDKLLKKFEQFTETIKSEWLKIEPGLNLSLLKVEKPEYIIDPDTTFRFIHAIHACPHGVYAWSKDIEGLVETSTNLASVKFIDENKIIVATSQRSSVDSAKKDMATKVESVFKLAGASIEQSSGYPGWKPNPDSKLLSHAKNSYFRLFNKNPKVRAIHAGLECGLFLEKYPKLDMISIGPTLRNVHSPDERIEIESVGKCWEYLLEILKTL